MRLAVLILGLTVLVFGTIGVVWSSVTGSRIVEEIERSFQLEPGMTLYVQGSNGSITYDTWDGDEVVVRATKLISGTRGLAERLGRQIVIDITEDASGVRVVQRGRLMFLFGFGDAVVTYQILVPEGWWGDITLRTSNGAIQANGIRGEAELRTSNGRITVDGQSGRLSATTSNGRIELAAVDGVVVAETSNGPVRVNGGRLEGAGRLRTSNGSVHLVAKLEKDASYSVRTSNGQVTLVLEEPDVTVDLATTNGAIHLNNVEVSATRVGRSELAGRVGSGSARLEARTSNGSITLSRAGAGAL